MREPKSRKEIYVEFAILTAVHALLCPPWAAFPRASAEEQNPTGVHFGFNDLHAGPEIIVGSATA